MLRQRPHGSIGGSRRATLAGVAGFKVPSGVGSILPRTRIVWFSVAVALLAGAASPPLAAPVSGDAVIRRPAGGSEIVITTTSRLAGAIHSLTWGGRQFIDSLDHGRQLQSASNLDLGCQLFNECFNPTEAGCERDLAGPTSRRNLGTGADFGRAVTQPGLRFAGEICSRPRCSQAWPLSLT